MGFARTGRSQSFWIHCLLLSQYLHNLLTKRRHFVVNDIGYFENVAQILKRRERHTQPP